MFSWPSFLNSPIEAALIYLSQIVDRRSKVIFSNLRNLAIFALWSCIFTIHRKHSIVDSHVGYVNTVSGCYCLLFWDMFLCFSILRRKKKQNKKVWSVIINFWTIQSHVHVFFSCDTETVQYWIMICHGWICWTLPTILLMLPYVEDSYISVVLGIVKFCYHGQWRNEPKILKG